MGTRCTDRHAKTNMPKIVQEHLKRLRRGENVLNTIIAIDETRIWDFDPELKSQNNVWKLGTSAQPKKCCRSQSKVKQMLTFVCDEDVIIKTGRVPNGITMTAAYYQNLILQHCTHK